MLPWRQTTAKGGNSAGQQLEQQKILPCCGQYMVAIMLIDQYLLAGGSNHSPKCDLSQRRTTLQKFSQMEPIARNCRLG